MENDFIAHFFFVAFASMFATGIVAGCAGLLANMIPYIKGLWDDGERGIVVCFSGVTLLVASIPLGVCLVLYLLFQPT
jgi:hypothetical protein